MSLTPKNWDAFQHYKDRSPAWIKLHRGLLDDYEYNCLPLASRALAPMLWLLASEYEHGAITASIKALAFRLRISEADFREAVKPLIDGGFFIDASGVLADCKHDASPEEKEEEEIQDKTEENIGAVAIATRTAHDGLFEEFWKAYPSRGKARNPKHPARKKFLALVKSGIDAATLIAAAGRYGATMREAGKVGTEFVAQAITWLNQQGWEDYGLPSPENVVPIAGHYAAFSSEELDAWAAFERASGKRFPRDKSGGWRFPTQWPPNHEQRAG